MLGESSAAIVNREYPHGYVAAQRGTTKFEGIPELSDLREGNMDVH